MKQTIYLDTSVVSAYYNARNPERQKLTKEFWEKLRGYKHMEIIAPPEL